jgi:opacity protein-like surface antigen
MKKVVSVVLIGAVFSITGPQSRADGLYLSLHGGASFPENTSSISDPGLPFQDSIVTDADTGYRLGAALGFAFNRYFSAEAEFSYDTNDIKSLSSGVLLPIGPLAASGTARFYSGMANAYLSLPAGAWRPYLGAGIGEARVKADDIGFVAIPQIRTTDSDTAFAWQLMAGLGYQISPNLELGARYRYFHTDDVTFVSNNGDIQEADGSRIQSVEAVLTWSWQRDDHLTPLK